MRPDPFYDRPDERAQTCAGDDGGALAFLGGKFEPAERGGDKILEFGRRHGELAVCAVADQGDGEFIFPGRRKRHNRRCAIRPFEGAANLAGKARPDEFHKLPGAV